MPAMNPNSGAAEIWGRWEPLVNIDSGCNPNPMVTHDGVVADSRSKFEPLCAFHEVRLLVSQKANSGSRRRYTLEVGSTKLEAERWEWCTGWSLS